MKTAASRARSGTHPGPPTSSVGLHRVLEPDGVLPQAAWRLDTDPRLRSDEVRVGVERLNLDAASFRQLSDKHGGCLLYTSPSPRDS